MWATHQSLNKDGLLEDLHPSLKLELTMCVNEKLIKDVRCHTAVCLSTRRAESNRQLWLHGTMRVRACAAQQHRSARHVQRVALQVGCAAASCMHAIDRWCAL